MKRYVKKAIRIVAFGIIISLVVPASQFSTVFSAIKTTGTLPILGVTANFLDIALSIVIGYHLDGKVTIDWKEALVGTTIIGFLNIGSSEFMPPVLQTIFTVGANTYATLQAQE